MNLQIQNYLVFFMVATFSTPSFGASVTKTATRLKSQCAEVVSEFGTRDLPFSFKNYRGHAQNSVTKIKATRSLGCLTNGADYQFTFERTTDPKISMNIYAKALGNHKYDFGTTGSTCYPLAYEVFKQRLLGLGVVWTEQFDLDFRINISNEYCPMFEKAVRNKVIEVIQQL